MPYRSDKLFYVLAVWRIDQILSASLTHKSLKDRNLVQSVIDADPARRAFILHPEYLLKPDKVTRLACRGVIIAQSSSYDWDSANAHYHWICNLRSHMNYQLHIIFVLIWLNRSE